MLLPAIVHMLCFKIYFRFVLADAECMLRYDETVHIVFGIFFWVWRRFGHTPHSPLENSSPMNYATRYEGSGGVHQTLDFPRLQSSRDWNPMTRNVFFLYILSSLYAGPLWAPKL